MDGHINIAQYTNQGISHGLMRHHERIKNPIARMKMTKKPPCDDMKRCLR